MKHTILFILLFVIPATAQQQGEKEKMGRRDSTLQDRLNTTSASVRSLPDSMRLGGKYPPALVKSGPVDWMTLSCFPNPASKEVTIRFTYFIGASAKVILYDMGGTECMSRSVIESDGNDTHFDVSSLPNASYLVGVVSGSNQISKIIEVKH